MGRAPFNLARVHRTPGDDRIRTNGFGTVNDEQAELLRRYVVGLRGESLPRDSLRYRCVRFNWTIPAGRRSGCKLELWRFCFARITRKFPAPHFDVTTGVICESDAYVPWQSVTAILLYWQLMESMLEPGLSSVQILLGWIAAGECCLGSSGRELAKLSLSLARAPLLSLAALRYVAGLSPGSIQFEFL